MLYRFTCGHVGRTNNPPIVSISNTQAFIKVAEIRGRPIEDVDKKCPACK